MSNAQVSARDAACIADDVEARAVADFYRAAPPMLQAQLGLQVVQVAGATLLVASRLPEAMFNRAIGLGMQHSASLEDVQRIVETYRNASVQGWWLHWNPFALPQDLPACLLSDGFTEPRRKSWAKMLRGTAPPPAIASDLKIEPLRDDQVSDAARAIVRSYEMPAFMVDWIMQLHNRPCWTLYGVCDGGDVVGGGALYTEDTDAWLGLGGVLPTHRRRGGQGRLMTLRIEEAIAKGATRIVTETGEAIADEPNPSLGNMIRCGFTRVASRLNFIGPGLPQAF
jgi:hypothetical protein